MLKKWKRVRNVAIPSDVPVESGRFCRFQTFGLKQQPLRQPSLLPVITVSGRDRLLTGNWRQFNNKRYEIQAEYEILK